MFYSQGYLWDFVFQVPGFWKSFHEFNSLVLQRNVRQLAPNFTPKTTQNASKVGFSMPKNEYKKAENTNLAL
jgi:hypothetical protein